MTRRFCSPPSREPRNISTVSKDTDFGSVVRHLKGETKLIARRRGNRKAAKAAKERGGRECQVED